MKLYVYRIYDKVAKVYSLQILDKDPAVVEESHRRQLTLLSVKDKSKLDQFKDHSLELIGTMDDNKGVIDLVDATPVVDFDNIIVNLGGSVDA